MKNGTPLLALLVVATAACILSDTSHTLYLEADGSVTWTVLEADIRSDARHSADRAAEEQRYVADLDGGTGPHAIALSRLGARDVATALIRDRRPWAALTSGRFDSAPGLARALMAAFGAPGRVDLVIVDGVSTLTVEIWLDEVDEDALSEADPVLALVADEQDYRLVAADACFVAARGFAISEDRRSVTLDLPSDEEVEAAAGRIVLSLSWAPLDTVGDPSPAASG